MRQPTATRDGDIAYVEVRSGDWVVVRGALRDGRIEPGGALTVQGAIIDCTLVGDDAVLIVQGAVAGVLEVEPGAVAIVSGVVTGRIVNAGRLLFHGEVVDGTIETKQGGLQVGIDALPEELRAQLRTTITQQ
jgi:hypothetical protein